MAKYRGGSNMTKIKELKENDVIIFQNITKDMKNNCQAIVNKKMV